MAKPSNDRKKWTREETILAVNLYCRISFGRQHSRSPEIIELANALERTPSSVSMRLNNLTSLDENEIERGVKGLTSASNLDREVWKEFQADWDRMIKVSLDLWNDWVGVLTLEEEHDSIEIKTQSQLETEYNYTTAVKTRAHQAYFRASVLSAYGGACAITGITHPQLLEAAHIIPWHIEKKNRLNPKNGMCLNSLCHKAFDEGLISIGERYDLLVSKDFYMAFRKTELSNYLKSIEGTRISVPEKLLPEREFLRWHRENKFKSN